MLSPSRLFKWGVALLVVSIVSAVALPIAEPANHQDPGFGFWLSWYVRMMWVPALILMALAAIIAIGSRIVDWVEKRE